ncbi:MAG: hypothetical protein FWG02_10035 [Holophagaceae bacterium]|nr:hypothetical protein [Holophagaceae bacterium]
MSTEKCPKCGGEQFVCDDNKKITCEYCDTIIRMPANPSDDSSSVGYSTTALVASVSPIETTKKSTNKKIGIAIASILAVCIIGGYLAWKSTGKKVVNEGQGTQATGAPINPSDVKATTTEKKSSGDSQNINTPAPPSITLAQGTSIFVRATSDISTNRVRAGEGFSAVLDEDIVASGKTVAKRGATVRGVVSNVVPGNQTRGTSMSLKLTNLTLTNGSKSITTDEHTTTAPTGASQGFPDIIIPVLIKENTIIVFNLKVAVAIDSN